jgi:hypothetical protein
MYVASMTPVPGVRLATRLPPQTYYPKTILGLLNSLGTTLLCPNGTKVSHLATPG